MSIFKQKASNNNGAGTTEIPPAGSSPAVLVAIIDLGTHTEAGFQGKASREVHKIYLVWELTAEKKSASTQNHVIARDFNASFNEKANLRIWIEKWFAKPIPEGQEFDLTKLLGKKCLLTISHKEAAQSGRTFAKLEGISPVPKGLPVPDPQNDLISWEIGTGDPIPDQDWLPFIYGEPVADVIKRSHEWVDKALANAPTHETVPPAESENADEIPF